MNVLAAQPEDRLRIARRLVILVIAGLLVPYHLTMLYELAGGQGLSSDPLYNAVQAALRAVIVVSLIGVVLGRQAALWTMWLGIGGLVATHYWAHFGSVPADFTSGRHPLSYLKGFIFPSIVTTAFLYRRQ